MVKAPWDLPLAVFEAAKKQAVAMVQHNHEHPPAAGSDPAEYQKPVLLAQDTDDIKKRSSRWLERYGTDPQLQTDKY